MILVGNKSDIWQERQVVTDKACQVVKMIEKTKTSTMMMMIMIKNVCRRQRRPAIPIILRSPLGRVSTRCH